MLDATCWITLWNRYPLRVPAFAALWARLEEMIRSGEVISPDVVLEELERGGDGLVSWFHDKNECFQRLDDMVQAALQQVLARDRDFAREEATETSADPFIVALAVARNGVVVTDEKHKKPGGITKIPDACDKADVRCIGLLEFLRETT